MKLAEVKKNGVRQWRLDFTAAGKRQRLFFRDEEKAKSELVKQEKQLRELGEDSISITSQDRNELRAAQEILKPTGATMLEAARFYVAHSKSRSEKPLLEALEECTTAKLLAGKRPYYVNSFKRTVKRFISDRGGKPCSDTTQEQIEAWLAKCENTHSRRSMLIDVRTFFSFCLKRGWVAKNPCAEIEPILLEQKAPCIFTPKQARGWMEAITQHDPMLIPYFAICMFAGVRPEECKRLTIEHVHAERGFINIPAEIAKGRRRRIVHLEPNAVVWLKNVEELPKICQIKRIIAVREKCGLKWGHDIMRHSFASYYLALHESADKTALEMGNSPQILFERYREVVTKEAAKEFFSIFPKSSIENSK